MLKENEEELILDYEKLPRNRQLEIEKIIEQKIKERQAQELKHLLKEVRAEIDKKQKG
jgi:hypothetical protein